MRMGQALQPVAGDALGLTAPDAEGMDTTLAPASRAARLRNSRLVMVPRGLSTTAQGAEPPSETRARDHRAASITGSNMYRM